MTDPTDKPDFPPTASTAIIVPKLAKAAKAPAGRHLATQTEYPWRTALVHGGGTFVAYLIAIASILGDSTIQGFINTYVPGQAAGVIGFGVFCGALATALSRVANLSKVAALRTRIGIGPIPKP